MSFDINKHDWISVDDELPSGYVDVLVWPTPADQGVTYGDSFTAQFSSDRNEWFVNCEDSYNCYIAKINVTHWMPLPQPPQSKEWGVM